MQGRGSSAVRSPPSPTKPATRRCPADSPAPTLRRSVSSGPLSCRKENETTQRTAASDHGPPPPAVPHQEPLDPGPVVVPAKAGTQCRAFQSHWIPAFAGMTHPFPIALAPAARRARTDASLLLRLVLLALVLGNVRAPRRRLDRAGRLPHDVELAVCLHLADKDGLVQMVVLLVHLDRESVRRLERLTGHRGNHLVDVGRFGFLDRLLPHVYADIRRFHRVVCERPVGGGHRDAPW